MKKVSKGKQLWKDIVEDDFFNEADHIVDEEIADFEKREMTRFIQNVNLMRHLPRLSDSLKPVERRGLYALYLKKAIRTRIKSSDAVSGVMKYHPHGDTSIYGTMVGLGQPWIKPVPLIQRGSNFGSDKNPGGYAAMRYTNMELSKYGYDCFFKDYDPDCIETIFNTAHDCDEPMVLPSKYPNILVNGGFGLASGNMYCVPTYQIPDIVKLTKKLLRNRDAGGIYMLPDSPTGCDIVDNGTLREICDTGEGVLRMRSTITIEENPKKPNIWILRVHNLPWMTDLNTVVHKLAELTKNGILPIKDTEDHSYPIEVKDANGVLETRTIVKYDIHINRAHDPEQVKAKLYKLTQLEKPIKVNFRVVEDALDVDTLNMREMILSWIDTRREYKRRLLNRKISKMNADLQILEILLVLTSKDNLSKTTQIIQTHTEEELIDALTKSKVAKISSYHAKSIADMKLRAFTKDAHKRYKKEKEDLEKKLKDAMSMAKSSKKIDDAIDMELDDLMKYATPRRSKIVSANSSIAIANTDHFVTVTKLGMIKKLPYNPVLIEKKKTTTLGVFKKHDYPVHGLVVNNHDSLMLFDNFGRFSNVPVHMIESTEPSQYGSTIFDTAKLNGEVVTAVPFFNQDTLSYVENELEGVVSLITLSKNGYLKKTPIADFTKTRNQMNIRAMNIRKDDELIEARFGIEHVNDGMDMLIYTEKGNFAYIRSDQIATQSKDASGLLSITLDPDDACRGMCVIGNHDNYLVVLTEKGCMKKCELDYLGEPGKRKMSSYLATLDVGDSVHSVNAIEGSEEITVCTRTSYEIIKPDQIPTRTRKAKCKKIISVPLGNNIISVGVNATIVKGSTMR